MPFPTGTRSQKARQFDAQLELRSVDDTALAATTATDAISFDADKQDLFKVVVNMPVAYTGYVADTSHWEVEVQAATAQAGPYTTVGSIDLKDIADSREVALSGYEIGRLFNWEDVEFVRLNVAKVGTPGDLSIGAYICK